MDSSLMNLDKLRIEIETELLSNIVPFWLNKSLDLENGGFVGRIKGSGDYDWKSNKSIILNSRILWSFSALYNHYKKPDYYDIALRAYDFIKQNFWDREFGGVYWSISHTGSPVQTKKQIYGQAFIIYALSEFYKCKGDKAVLSDAIDVFHLIEVHSFDKNKEGYVEAFSREWDSLEDVRLSDKDINANLTTNTHLHLLEAYTNLSQVWKNDKVQNQMKFLIELFLNKIIDSNNYSLRLFFNDSWESLTKEVSFGTNIETCWLLCKAAAELGSNNLIKDVESITIKMSDKILEMGFNSEGGLLYKDLSGIVDDDAHWWPQAEAMIGFLNTYQISGDKRYIEAVYGLWTFTRNQIIDNHTGEWHFKVSSNGTPCGKEDKIGPWKAPYHNMRACLEVLKRTSQCTTKLAG